MFIQQKILCCLVVFYVYVGAQYHYTFVTSSNDFDATAFSNSHKIVPQYGEGPNDTIHIVYHSSDSIYYTYTTNRGQSWRTPFALYQGTYPAFDIDTYGFRHIAWQVSDSIYRTYEIYYDCLDDYAPPVNISETPTHSILPDLVVDSGIVPHIIWTEEVNGHNHIYYRTYENGIPGDTFRVSGCGSVNSTYSYASISIFQPNGRIYIIWDCHDPDSYSPYQIHCRYKEGNVWSDTDVWTSAFSMRHSSIDFSHNWDLLSACWEDSTSGNLEAFFYGGNGGGYPTQGNSIYPVISTVGPIWSYLFWQEDSADFDDIYYHFYYMSNGWYDYGSLRRLFDIQESIRFPNCCGAYLVWTQGDTSPYSIYFADFDYPIGVEETIGHNKTTPLSISPNPFSKKIDIRFTMHDLRATMIKICDAAGRLVKNFSLHPSSFITHNSISWDGIDNSGNQVPAGTYFCVLKNNKKVFLEKIVKLK